MPPCRLIFCLIIVFMTEVAAWEEGSLQILASDAIDASGLEALAERFANTKRVAVSVRVTAEAAAEFSRTVTGPDGPDIYIGSDQQLSSWVRASLISPLPSSPGLTAAIDPLLWRGLQLNGQTFAYPLAIEGPLQLCNAALIDDVIATDAALNQAAIRLSAAGKYALGWDYRNPYLSYGLLTVAGGFAYDFTDDGYNTSITGVDSAGALPGLEALMALLAGDVMAPVMSADDLAKDFIAGNIACLISDFHALKNFQQAGLTLLVGPYPSFAGNQPRPFVERTAILVNAASPNQQLAVDFIVNNLLAEGAAASIIDTAVGGVAVYATAAAAQAEKDPLIRQASLAWQQLEPVPTVSQMSVFWLNLSMALHSILSAEQTPADALALAAQNIANAPQPLVEQPKVEE